MAGVVAAFILARAGSKGLPGKNIRVFAGKPLLTWSVEAARGCGRVDRIIVSTDGVEIADVARSAGAEVFMRPAALATDTAAPKDAIRHHVDEMARAGRAPDVVVLLQPTSPLRRPEDVSACLDEIEAGADAAVTFVKAPSNPHRAWRIENGTPAPFIAGGDPWAPRQALPEAYAINGAVYAARTEALLGDPTGSFLVGEARAVIMPPERSIDIDTALDFAIGEAVKAFLDAGDGAGEARR
jgi:CMP-N,N'-diacetyllegionaminic acid synthase